MLECGENSGSMGSVGIQMLECGDTNVRMWGEFWLNEVCGDTQGCKCFLFFRISYFFNACAHSPFLKFKM